MTDKEKLPSAPSPAEKRLDELFTLCANAGQVGDLTGATVRHAVPEPVSTEGAADDRCEHQWGDTCDDTVQVCKACLARRTVAAPIAPAAASGFEEWWLDNVNDLRMDAEEADEDDGLFCARAAWNAAYVRNKLESVRNPSAEGDGWISVTERLPRTGAECLVVYDGVVQRIAYCREGLGFACVDGYVWRPADEIVCDPIHDNDVTHWRLLPAPPSGQGEKE